MANDRLSKQYNQDFTQLLSKYTLAGTPDDCADRLRQYVDAGATTVILAPACPSDYAETNLDLMGREVVARLRSE